MDDQWAMAFKFGTVFVGAIVVLVFAVSTFTQGSLIGDSTPDPNKTVSGETKSWNEYKSTVGLEFPARVSSENVVLIPEDTYSDLQSGESELVNFNDPDVTSVGADSDESDTQELIKTADVNSGEDYYEYTTFNSQITSNLPNSGTYKVAIIGSGVGNVFTEITIPEQVADARVDNSLPIQPLSTDVDNGDKQFVNAYSDVKQYATDSDISAKNTKVVDDGSTIALSNDWTSESDSNVDGTVTAIKEYEISNDKVVQLGSAEVSNVDGNVSELTVRVFADGEQVFSDSDTDFSDADGLDDEVEFESADLVTDTFTVETDIDFDDSGVSSSTALVDVILDDADEDGNSDDGSYGITELSTTWTGY